jgi:uncharacterized RDD family membrane protein YckC
MSSMPERDAPGQRNDLGGQSEFGGKPSGGSPYGGGYPDDPYGAYGAGQPGGSSPVNRAETQVVGRRVVQYIIDYILVGIIPGLAYWLLDRGSGFLHGFGWALATLIALVVYLWYWVLRPNSHQGQTFGMQLLGVRVISKGGGPASMLQYFVRGVMLIIDTLFFGLVGLITMIASRYHQRVGDHLARTLVVGAGHGASAPEGGRRAWQSGATASDERLASPDMYAEDRYGQRSTPDTGMGGSGTSPRDQ